MIICYDSKTGDITHTMEVSDVAAYKSILDKQGTKYIEAKVFGKSLSMRQHTVVNGALVAKPQFAITAPTQMKVGVESSFTGVPMGAAISINRTPFPVMDDSGALEFTPQTAGSYQFVFSGLGYVSKEFTIEALA